MFALLAIIGAALLLISPIAISQGWKTVTTDKHYTAAESALKDGNWAQARTELDLLDQSSPGYKDSQTMRKETYYRPAKEAFQAREYSQAIADLELLSTIDPQYKDAPTLLRDSYFIPAKTAFDNKEWETAREKLKTLLRIAPADKDALDLYKDSYYQPFLGLLAAGDIETACGNLVNELSSVAGPTYKDLGMQRQECHYQPGIAAFSRREWAAARVKFKPILDSVKVYKDTGTKMAESYYRQAMEALNAEQWKTVTGLVDEWKLSQSSYEAVRNAVIPNPDPGVAPDKVEIENAYRQAKRTYDSQLYSEALPLLEQVLQIDKNYKNTPDMHKETLYQLEQIKYKNINDKTQILHTGSSYPIRALVFSPNGAYLASGAGDKYTDLTQDKKKVTVWDIHNLLNNQATKEFWLDDLENKGYAEGFTMVRKQVFSVAFSKDNRFLFAASRDPSLRSWELRLPNSRGYKIMNSTEEGYLEVEISPNGQILAASTLGHGSIDLWNPDYPTNRYTVFSDTSNEIYQLVFTPDGKTLISGDEVGQIRFWDAVNRSSIGRTLSIGGNIKTLVLSPDGKSLYAANGRNSIQVIDITTQQIIGSIPTPAENASEAAFSPNGKFMAVIEKGSVLLLDQEGKLVRRLIEGEATSIAFSPDSSLLAVGLDNGIIQLWRVSS